MLHTQFEDLDLSSPIEKYNPFGLTLGVNQIAFNEGECDFVVAEDFAFPPICHNKSLSFSGSLIWRIAKTVPAKKEKSIPVSGEYSRGNR
jgi:hypothetical protein